MGLERELQPVRNLVYALAFVALCSAAILRTPVSESPYKLREALAQATNNS
jgi:hypothetical protein